MLELEFEFELEFELEFEFGSLVVAELLRLVVAVEMNAGRSGQRHSYVEQWSRKDACTTELEDGV